MWSGLKPDTRFWIELPRFLGPYSEALAEYGIHAASKINPGQDAILGLALFEGHGFKRVPCRKIGAPGLVEAIQRVVLHL